MQLKSFVLGQLSDEENDGFVVEMQEEKDSFTSVSMNDTSIVVIEVDLKKAKL